MEEEEEEEKDAEKEEEEEEGEEEKEEIFALDKWLHRHHQERGSAEQILLHSISGDKVPMPVTQQMQIFLKPKKKEI